jgi:2,4-dienoyl-CoA reductase-like NADH-dependent reductase (Old Yellow Enzyme family)
MMAFFFASRSVRETGRLPKTITPILPCRQTSASVGKPTPEYIKLYEEWGKVGFAVLTTLGTPPNGKASATFFFASRSVRETGRLPKTITPILPCRQISASVYAEAFKPVIAAAKAHGSLVIGQTTHGGRQVSEDVNKRPTETLRQ